MKLHCLRIIFFFSPKYYLQKDSLHCKWLLLTRLVLIYLAVLTPRVHPFRAAWNNVLQRYSKSQLAAWSSLLIYQALCIVQERNAGFGSTLYSTKQKPKNLRLQIKISKELCQDLMIRAFILGYFYSEDFNIPYDWGSMPPWYCTPLKTSRLSKMDTWIYFMHRLMHHRTFYLYLHKLHHECKMASSQHIFSLILKTMVTRSRRLYDIPWNLLQYIPFTVSTNFHDFHCSSFHRNYSPVFSWWDKSVGTEEEHKAFLAKKKQKEIQKSDSTSSV
uniref:Uncharacterized protein n=1 Tax=Otus sunia TaxID=257818 RepID=A0A8C8A6P1_9STRI